MTEKEANQKYETTYFEAKSALELHELMNAFYLDRGFSISVRDVAYLTEMRASRMNPQQPTVIFIAIVTYRIERLAN